MGEDSPKVRLYVRYDYDAGLYDIGGDEECFYPHVDVTREQRDWMQRAFEEHAKVQEFLNQHCRQAFHG